MRLLFTGGRSSPFGLNAIINTGQSLSNGAAVTPSGTDPFHTQPYSNVMLSNSNLSVWIPNTVYAAGSYMNPGSNGYVFHTVAGGTSVNGPQPTWNTTIGGSTTDGTITWVCDHLATDTGYPTAATLSMQPYTEPPRTIANGINYPANCQGEALGIGITNTLTHLALAAGFGVYKMAGSDVGAGGQDIAGIGKGGTVNSYAAAMYEAAKLKGLANAAGLTFGYLGVFLTHGEANWPDTSYGAQATTLQINYEADLRAITGQTLSIPMFCTQQSSTPVTQDAVPSSVYLPISAFQILAACNAAPTKMVMVGPKYHQTYGSGSQHMSGVSQYDMLAEKNGQAAWAVLNGGTWRCVQPLSFSASIGASTVTITFDVMFPPLVFDTTTVPLNHQSSNTYWANGMGFEAFDNTGILTISSAAIQNGNQVVLTFSRAVAAGLCVQYAVTTDETNPAITGSCDKPGGHYGNLRDSDTFVGPFTGIAQRNWCVLFRQTGIT